jgi:KDO2-lipid IV(A) lauroyltransferase
VTGGAWTAAAHSAAARASDLGYAAGWAAVKRVPEPLADRATAAAAAWFAGRDGARVRQLRANLRVATGGRLTEPELHRLTTRAVLSYARYWEEAFRLPVLAADRVVRDSVMPGREHLEKPLAERRPVVIALPHSGNWDAAGVWLVERLQGPFLTVVERLQPEALFRRFVDFRESLGMRVVPLTGGPRPSPAVLREWLAGGGTVCLLVDRDLTGGGVPVRLFGRATTMPAGPALLAAQTGAALLPAVCQFDGAGWSFTVHPEVPVDGPGRLRDRVATALQGVADAFASTIAERPEDWHVLGRVWPDVPPDPPRGTGRASAGGAR